MVLVNYIDALNLARSQKWLFAYFFKRPLNLIKFNVWNKEMFINTYQDICKIKLY